MPMSPLWPFSSLPDHQKEFPVCCSTFPTPGMTSSHRNRASPSTSSASSSCDGPCATIEIRFDHSRRRRLPANPGIRRRLFLKTK
ncbi:hypothetical protein GQ55_5G313000 [Panicum hallii var. hallii]|uniref:Uncharacterized protein n=1 Tax=Panicum hallii var. hallii TaxID=1504633 RepID=A0A2T7DLN4_9POAL|nr:hypothetical protein GQ55_5G313000 [Panicum hallii var. hallii]